MSDLKHTIEGKRAIAARDEHVKRMQAYYSFLPYHDSKKQGPLYPEDLFPIPEIDKYIERKIVLSEIKIIENWREIPAIKAHLAKNGG